MLPNVLYIYQNTKFFIKTLLKGTFTVINGNYFVSVAFFNRTRATLLLVFVFFRHLRPISISRSQLEGRHIQTQKFW